MNRTINIGFQDKRFNIFTTEDQRDWYMTLQEAAQVYGISESTVFNHMANHPEEFIEGYDKGLETFNTPGGPQKKVIIYKMGVIKLGFHVHNPRAVAFRSYAAELAASNLDKCGVIKTNFGDFLDTREDLEDIMQYAIKKDQEGSKP
jgi:hypothetical protein